MYIVGGINMTYDCHWISWLWRCRTSARFHFYIFPKISIVLGKWIEIQNDLVLPFGQDGRQLYLSDSVKFHCKHPKHRN